MMIDRIPFAGVSAYLTGAGGEVNLAEADPRAARTPPLRRGEQNEVTSLEFLIESMEDLRPLFARQASFLLAIDVVKEMFPGHFGDPFSHRVYNLAGFEDFKSGESQGCRVMDIDGVPTLVSEGTGESRWISRWYELPAATSFGAAGWELATSRQTPEDSFTLSLDLHFRNAGGAEQVVPIVQDSVPSAARRSLLTGVLAAKALRLEMRALVKRDADLHERHGVVLADSLGRPLLRAVNLLEAVASRYEFFSLAEFLSACADYELHPERGDKLLGVAASLELPATLVYSENQVDSTDEHEFLAVRVGNPALSRVEVRLAGERLIRLRKR